MRRWPFPRSIWVALLLCAALLAGSGQAEAHEADVLEHVGFDQRLNQQVPLTLAFRDEAGRRVQLADYFAAERPVILVLGYFDCPNLCSMVNRGLAESLTRIPYQIGTEFTVVSVSIDPRETPATAARKKREYLALYDRAGAEQGWHMLTGEEPAIRQLAAAVGFRYMYSQTMEQYAHASGITILTPEGRVARYFYGLNFPASALRLGLVEASANQIGAPIDKLLTLCYQYDALSGQYTLAILNIIKLIGVVTVLMLGGFIGVMLWRERQGKLQVQG